MNFAIEHVGCLPWDFPVPFKWEEAKLEVCHSASPDTNQTNNMLAKFYEAMNNDSNLRTCQCMPDCEATVYDTQVKIYCYMTSLIILVFEQVASVPLDPEKLCQDDTKTYDFAFKAMLRITSPLAEIARLRTDRVWNSLSYISLSTFNHQKPRYNGFTKEQILQHCLNFFANETAQVTIEFLDTDVMQIKRDSRFSIMDQFGIIGDN